MKKKNKNRTKRGHKDQKYKWQITVEKRKIQQKEKETKSQDAFANYQLSSSFLSPKNIFLQIVKLGIIHERDEKNFLDQMDLFLYTQEEELKKGMKKKVPIRSISHVSFFPCEYSKNPKNWVPYFGHVIPTVEALLKIRTSLPWYNQCISIGAGVGLWEYLLSEDPYAEFYVDCIDPYPPLRSFMPIQKRAAEEVEWNHHSYNILMIIWPLPRQGYDYFALTHFKGQYVIYIGLHPQCQAQAYQVGSLSFRKLLHSSTKWTLLWSLELPSVIHTWIKYRPVLYFYKRT